MVAYYPKAVLCFFYNTGTSPDDILAERVLIQNIEIHPAWKGVEYGSIDGDLAIIEVDGASSFQSAKISTSPVKANDEILVGGYGCLGGPKDLTTKNIPLTIAAKTVEKIVASSMVVGLYDSMGSNLSFACNGDSGGPAYRKNKMTSELEIVGINSFVTTGAFYFKFDPNTSNIIGINPNWTGPVEFWLTRLSFAESESNLKTMQWLRKFLPATSFSD